MDVWVNRTLCGVLEEMRKCNETRNFSYLSGLIEEAQSMGNRMESKLDDVRDLDTLTQRISKLKKELKDLRKEKNELTEDKL